MIYTYSYTPILYSVKIYYSSVWYYNECGGDRDIDKNEYRNHDRFILNGNLFEIIPIEVIIIIWYSEWVEIKFISTCHFDLVYRFNIIRMLNVYSKCIIWIFPKIWVYTFNGILLQCNSHIHFISTSFCVTVVYDDFCLFHLLFLLFYCADLTLANMCLVSLFICILYKKATNFISSHKCRIRMRFSFYLNIHT